MEPVRKFKIIVNSKECGTCSGATPSAVAKKVVKKLCGTSSKVVKFSLKECKRGCEKVCGPYHGRMEKLDRPYTRSGKKITHRVVCEKVRKMKGGRDLTIDDFEKREGDPEFKIENFSNHPYVYFGEIVSNNNGKKRYEYLASIDDTWNQFHIQEINNDKVQIISLSKQNADKLYQNSNLINKLKELKEFLSNPNMYKNNSKNIYFHRYLKYLITFISNILSNLQSKNSHTIKQNNLPEFCKKYNSNYKFSGEINGIKYNTNKLFKGSHLYSYDPRQDKYIKLLDELDYLVNIYDENPHIPTSIVYSGVLDNRIISTRRTNNEIKISDINHYLYCSNYKNIPEQYNTVNITCPCWIIVKK